MNRSSHSLVSVVHTLPWHEDTQGLSKTVKWLHCGGAAAAHTSAGFHFQSLL
jgi:hypothetical protein